MKNLVISSSQQALCDESASPLQHSHPSPVNNKQLLKWIGNKQRFAKQIVSHFPFRFSTYYEPFFGSGAVLGALSPNHAFASDVFKPLVDLWQSVKTDVDSVIDWYAERYALIEQLGKAEAYLHCRQNYNASPNAADLLFLSRACYGGVIRFRKADGHMSTPVGAHMPIPPSSFAERAYVWEGVMKNVDIACLDFEEALSKAKKGDLVYLDPPYVISQSILYGAQDFSIQRLFKVIEKLSTKGVHVALSIDGTKMSGSHICDVEIPPSLFKREITVDVGRSMLKRFQMQGQTLEKHSVTDRLLLNY